MLRPILMGALQSGYERLIEPCAGGFAICNLARSLKWKPEQMYASDVTLLTSVVGRYVAGDDLSGMNIEVDGIEVDTSDHAEVLYAHEVLKTEAISGKWRPNRRVGTYYWTEIADHMRADRERYIGQLRVRLDKAKDVLGGFQYQAMDMFEHFEEVMDDEKAIVILCPPTYKGGYEKFYDTAEKLRWSEPDYEILRS